MWLGTEFSFLGPHWLETVIRVLISHWTRQGATHKRTRFSWNRTHNCLITSRVGLIIVSSGYERRERNGSLWRKKKKKHLLLKQNSKQRVRTIGYRTLNLGRNKLPSTQKNRNNAHFKMKIIKKRNPPSKLSAHTHTHTHRQNATKNVGVQCLWGTSHCGLAFKISKTHFFGNIFTIWICFQEKKKDFFVRVCLRRWKKYASAS